MKRRNALGGIVLVMATGMALLGANLEPAGPPTSPPGPLSSSALLRNAAWRGGAREEARSDSPSPRSEAELERGLGG